METTQTRVSKVLDNYLSNIMSSGFWPKHLVRD
jgi:hypothetical protein